MNEDTRMQILRLQKKYLTVLAALWTGCTEIDFEIDATLRVYRRHLSILDRYLAEARQTGTIKDAAEAINDEAVVLPRRITGGNARSLIQFGDVHQVEGVYAHHDTQTSFTSTASNSSTVDATTARPLPQIPERPVVRLPPPALTARERLDKFLQEISKAQTQSKALQVYHGRLDNTVDTIVYREENIDVIDLSSSSVTSEAATCDPVLQSIDHSATTTRTIPERSVDRLPTPGGPSLKTEASAVTKKESKPESSVFVPKDTIKEMTDNLLQLSGPFSSPTLCVRNAGFHYAHCAVPPEDEPPRPASGSDATTYQGFTGPISITPGTQPDEMGPNIDQLSQQFNDRGDLHQQGGCSRQLSHALSTSPALSASSTLGTQAISDVSPALQKQMLGEALYPKIHEQQLKLAALYPKVRARQPELTAKLTGMLLELDNAELRRLNTDDAALSSDVDEAMRVLDNSFV
ncbi:hypothetical protein KCU61_g8222, partial [Aureobasidium melanogenum]